MNNKSNPPANGSNVYCGLYSDGKPIALLQGPYYSIEISRGQLVPDSENKTSNYKSERWIADIYKK